ncbi:tagatose-6-phosphate kinase [Dehalococcoidia bacterium]|nr:tagatose-6-phosphate kinase [Dehalococcoidia bacterium]
MNQNSKISFLDIVRAQRRHGNCTLLGVGPMSKNSVDTVIEIANERFVPILLIPSRRQVECSEFGGGYVNSWTTEEFAEYVRERDRFGYTILCRDHGGPWQATFEVEGEFGLEEAMASAKRSYEVDILSDFKVIHLDPSLDPFGNPDIDEVLRRMFELMDFCVGVARTNGRQIYFEVGTEETDGRIQDLNDFEYFINSTREFCEDRQYDLPVFAVGQTGTLVKETANVGVFQSHFRTPGVMPAELHIPWLVKVTESNGFMLKEHNADYLPDDIMVQHPKLGIHAANIAPQLGVVETTTILRICDRIEATKEKEHFIRLGVDSQKWMKWMMPNSTADDFQKCVIAGHYVFSTPAFKEINHELDYRAKSLGIDLGAEIRSELKSLVLGFAKKFNLLDLEVVRE